MIWRQFCPHGARSCSQLFSGTLGSDKLPVNRSRDCGCHTIRTALALGTSASPALPSGAPDIRSWYVALSALIACAKHCRHCRTRLLVSRTESNTHRRPLLSARPCASVRQLSRPARQTLVRGIVRAHRLRELSALSHCRTRLIIDPARCSNTHRRPLLSARPCASVRHAGAPGIWPWHVTLSAFALASADGVRHV